MLKTATRITTRTARELARFRVVFSFLIPFVIVTFIPLSAFASGTLLSLASSQQEEKAIALVVSGETDQAESDGTTPLMYAAHYGLSDLALALLEAGANPNLTNDYGASAIGEAAFINDNRILSLLLEFGADPNLTNNEGETPLMVVARAGNIEGATLLLEHGAEINAQERWGGQTALMWAAAQQQPEMLSLLIKHNANVNLHGFSRLWERRITSEPRPKDMNKGGFSALHYAARQGCIECIDILASADADLDASDPDRVTPLNLALINFHFDTAAALIEAGADLNKWDLFGRTPLYNAIDLNTVPFGGRADIPSLDNHSGFDIAKMLLERGANPNLQLKMAPPFRNAVFDRGSDKVLTTGATPLLVAARIGDNEAAKLLLEHGAYVDLPNAYGQTPLLVAAGVDYPTAPTRGRFKTEQTSIETIQLLLNGGANINSISGDPSLRPNGNDIPRPDRNEQMHPANRGPDVVEGKTALHGAARNGWNQVAQYLIDQGIQQQVVDLSGRTPLDYAMGLYPPAYNDIQASPIDETVNLLSEACKADDNCSLNVGIASKASF